MIALWPLHYSYILQYTYCNIAIVFYRYCIGDYGRGGNSWGIMAIIIKIYIAKHNGRYIGVARGLTECQLRAHKRNIDELSKQLVCGESNRRYQPNFVAPQEATARETGTSYTRGSGG